MTQYIDASISLQSLEYVNVYTQLSSNIMFERVPTISTYCNNMQHCFILWFLHHCTNWTRFCRKHEWGERQQISNRSLVTRFFVYIFRVCPHCLVYRHHLPALNRAQFFVCNVRWLNVYTTKVYSEFRSVKSLLQRWATHHWTKDHVIF
jgi:hypothetical protein